MKIVRAELDLIHLSETGVPLDYTANDVEKDLQTLNEAILISKRVDASEISRNS